MSKKVLKTYNTIGKILCGIAGGIVGFVSFGSLAAVIGVLAGVVVGHILEKLITNPNLKESRK